MIDWLLKSKNKRVGDLILSHQTRPAIDVACFPLHVLNIFSTWVMLASDIGSINMLICEGFYFLLYCSIYASIQSYMMYSFLHGLPHIKQLFVKCYMFVMTDDTYPS